MSKYNYDKKVLNGLSVGPFLGEVKTREAAISAADSTLHEFNYNANNIAAKLHPHFQLGVIKEVKEQVDGKSFIIVPDRERGFNEFAPFRAGQYLSIAFTVGNAKFNKPYSICSSPEADFGSKDNYYEIAVKHKKDGIASEYILSNWDVGTHIVMSAPLGVFYYERLRDAGKIVAVAGGGGITPFLSMARAITTGQENYELTILYGSRTEASIMMRSELDEVIAKSGGRVKVVHILSEEEKEGYEHGFISADIIKKYAGDGDYSLFICGPKAMYNYEKAETEKLGLPRRRIRYELSGEFGNPANAPEYDKSFLGKEFKVTVLVRGEKTELVCKAEESLMSAVENAGIRVPSDCRSGKCGWCHSRLISGNVFVPEEADGRRAADKKFGWIHPCVTYPLSDIEMEVFPLFE